MGKRQTGFWRLVACISACVLAGLAAAVLSPPDQWYESLHKPAWTPPGWLFGVVSMVLYAMMGAALSLVLDRGFSAGGVRRAVVIFGIQLAVSLSWSPIFLGLHSPGAAMVVILLLWLLIGWTVAAFWSVRDVAGAMLLPFWAWVTFAIALNASIWRMNG